MASSSISGVKRFSLVLMCPGLHHALPPPLLLPRSNLHKKQQKVAQWLQSCGNRLLLHAAPDTSENNWSCHVKLLCWSLSQKSQNPTLNCSVFLMTYSFDLIILHCVITSCWYEKKTNVLVTKMDQTMHLATKLQRGSHHIPLCKATVIFKKYNINMSLLRMHQHCQFCKIRGQKCLHIIVDLW